MKKFIPILLIIFILPLSACGKGDYMASNMSEVTHIFYVGQVGSDYASISVGQREEPYQKDGVSKPKVDFSLISLYVEGYYLMRLDCIVTVNGVSQEVTLECVGGNYMYDLAYALSADDEITISYLNKSMTFENASKNFAVSEKRALEIAREQLSTELKEHQNKAEFYLRVLGQEGEGLHTLFWAFTMVCTDKSTYNCVINAQTGQIIA